MNWNEVAFVLAFLFVFFAFLAWLESEYPNGGTD